MIDVVSPSAGRCDYVWTPINPSPRICVHRQVFVYEVPFRIRADFNIEGQRYAGMGGNHIFIAVQNDLHMPSRHHRQRRGNHMNLQDVFRAKRPPNRRYDNPYLILRQAKPGGIRFPRPIRNMRRRPNGDALLLRPKRNRSDRLQMPLIDSVGHVTSAFDDRRFLLAFLQVAARNIHFHRPVELHLLVDLRSS
ncbi:hypothetical protein D3C74_215160 [compost metagenome]